MRVNRVEIDLGALRQNYRHLVASLRADVKVIACIKANAYGHGAVEVARVLEREGVFALATASLDDAIRVREAGVRTPVLLFGGILPDAFEEALAYDLSPTVYDEESAAAAARFGKQSPVPVYVKVDCGLERLGVSLPEAFDFVGRLHRNPGVSLAGLYTHIPFTDLAGRDWASGQLAEFAKLVSALRTAGIDVPVTQAMASSCLLAGLSDDGNAVCPGHLLYGLSPVQDEVADIAPYRPVLRSLRTQLIHVGRHGPGPPSASGNRLKTNGTRSIGVVPLGRYDGYRGPLPNRPATMILRGRRVPVIGVSLEYTTLALDDFEDPQPGESVTVIGDDGDDGIGLPEIADWWGMSPLDVLMSMNRRLPCAFID